LSQITQIFMGLWDFLGFGLMRDVSLVTHHVSRIICCQPPEILRSHFYLQSA
jgi:hypothetical protein